MNIKCFLGYHDWEDVDWVGSEAQLREALRAELHDRDVLRVDSGGISMPIADRVCLRCEKVDLALSKLRRQLKVQIMKEDLLKRTRRMKALQLARQNKK